MERLKVSYASLSEADKKAIDDRLRTRLNNFLDATNDPRWFQHRVLIIGDRPGPSAPQDDGYHHTPFYSTKHCSGWLNAALHIAQIPEERLIWINAADRLGQPTPFGLLEKLEPDTIICLGGNAEKWLVKSDFYSSYYKFDHPQYHKRFKNNEKYPFIEFLEYHFGLIELSDTDYF